MPKPIQAILVILALAAAVWWVYWPVRGYEFTTWDDPLYVTDNSHVQAGITAEGVKWAFTTNHASNWHPLTWLSHMLDCKLFGMNPAGPHLVNVGLHTVNVATLFLLLWWLTGEFWPAAFAAGAFALHPLRVESVAWISERKDVLSALFGLLCVAAYTGFVRQRRWWWYASACVSLALGLMAKPMLVTLPLLLLLLDVWPLRRTAWFPPADRSAGIVTLGKLALEKSVLMGISTASCVMTMISQRAGGSMASFDAVPLTARLGNAGMSYVRYLEKTFWPVDLAVVYPLPAAGSWPWWMTVGSAAVLVVITLVLAGMARSRPWGIVGWLWFVIALLPVIGLVQVGPQAMADRYTYLPHIGLFIVLTWGVIDLAGRPRWPVAALVGVTALAGMALASRAQVSVWRDSVTLYRAAVNRTTDNWVMQTKLALLLEGARRYEEATALFVDAARVRPNDALLQFKVADSLAHQGRIAEAMNGFRRALAIDPDHLQSLNNLAWFSATHTDSRLRNGEEAVRLAERACAVTGRKDPEPLSTLAAAYAETGRFEDALRTAEEAHALAMSSGRKPLAAEIYAQVLDYQQRRPTRR